MIAVYNSFGELSPQLPTNGEGEVWEIWHLKPYVVPEVDLHRSEISHHALITSQMPHLRRDNPILDTFLVFQSVVSYLTSQKNAIPCAITHLSFPHITSRFVPPPLIEKGTIPTHCEQNYGTWALSQFWVWYSRYALFKQARGTRDASELQVWHQEMTFFWRRGTTDWMMTSFSRPFSC